MHTIVLSLDFIQLAQLSPHLRQFLLSFKLKPDKQDKHIGFSLASKKQYLQFSPQLTQLPLEFSVYPSSQLKHFVFLFWELYPQL